VFKKKTRAKIREYSVTVNRRKDSRYVLHVYIFQNQQTLIPCQAQVLLLQKKNTNTSQVHA